MSFSDLRPSREKSVLLIEDGASACIGGADARLLAGPQTTSAPESLIEHLHRLGPLNMEQRSPEVLRALIREAGLVGRGGGEFPLAQKLELAARSAGFALVVINASESEPASRKDETLLRLRPHLVLDGASVVAAAVGAATSVIYVHAGRNGLTTTLKRAIEERRRAGCSTPEFVIVEAPERYVAGEASAVVTFLDEGLALPKRRFIPSAAVGVRGQPTIVSNTETHAHVALLARFGASWFRSAGSRQTPGSTLLTLAGDIPSPGTVIESLQSTTIGSILTYHAGLDRPPRAVLLGGYAGTWIDGAIAWTTALDRHALRRAGAPLGCGVVAVLGEHHCGIAETSRILEWMAVQSSGQCGPCISGLPAMADLASQLSRGRATSRDVGRLRRLAVSVRGRGACGHPNGAVGLLESALDTFAPEMRKHVRGQSCEARGVGLPLPAGSSGADQ